MGRLDFAMEGLGGRHVATTGSTYETIKMPSARPRPAGMGRLPASDSPGAAGPAGWARALETASLSLRLRTSMKEPSCTTVEGGAVGTEAGEGEGRRKEARESFERGRATRSAARGASVRVTGVGEVGRLEGRKRDVVVLRPYIVKGMRKVGSRSRCGGRWYLRDDKMRLFV